MKTPTDLEELLEKESLIIERSPEQAIDDFLCAKEGEEEKIKNIHRVLSENLIEASQNKNKYIHTFAKLITKAPEKFQAVAILNAKQKEKEIYYNTNIFELQKEKNRITQQYNKKILTLMRHIHYCRAILRELNIWFWGIPFPGYYCPGYCYLYLR